MDLPLRFVQAFLTLSVGVTIARLTTDTGGGDYFFTLIFLVVMGAAAPYWLAMKVMRRTPPRWAATRNSMPAWPGSRTSCANNPSSH